MGNIRKSGQKKSAALPRERQSGGGKAAQQRTKENAVPQNAAKNELLGAGAGLCRSLYIKVKRGKQDTSRRQKHEAKRKNFRPGEKHSRFALVRNTPRRYTEKIKGKANG